MLESKPQKTAALLARGGFGWWPVGPTGGAFGVAVGLQIGKGNSQRS